MSAPRAAAQLLRMPAARLFVPPAATRAGTAQRAVPTIALTHTQLARATASLRNTGTNPFGIMRSKHIREPQCKQARKELRCDNGQSRPVDSEATRANAT